MPIAHAAYPAGTSISERNPFVRGMRAVYPGKPIARSVMRPMPFEWWLRPVSTHDRVGEHSAVVWKFVNRSPSAASASNVPSVPRAILPLRRAAERSEEARCVYFDTSRRARSSSERVTRFFTALAKPPPLRAAKRHARVGCTDTPRPPSL